jgi:hypothetical protein
MSKHLPEESVEVFIDAARSYCSLIEAADALPRGQFVWQVGDRLTRLYAGATALPETDPTGIEGPEDRIGDAESFALEQRLREKLGDLDRYRRVYDPYDATETGVEGSLSDDLADIYRDVKNGVDGGGERRAAGRRGLGLAPLLRAPLGYPRWRSALRNPLDYAWRRRGVD